MREIPFVAYRLELRQANRKQRTLDERHRNSMQEARQRNAGKNELERIEHEYGNESELIWAPIYAAQSNRLVVQARKYGVRVPPQPRELTDSGDWYLSRATGERFLSDEAENRLKREIRAERRQNYDEFRKWATVVFAGLAFVLGVIAFLRTKQPNSCPKNYYRSDSGECIFALQNSEQSESPQQGTPQRLSVSPNKAKPSPSRH